MNKFNCDNFNFEEEYEKKRSEIQKPNILVCGATGVGKSTFVNDVFGKEVCKGGNGKPITRGINRCEDPSIDVVLYDSEGYEIGDDKQQYFKDNIIGCIKKNREKYPDDISKHIHEVWFFISAANKRVTDIDFEVIKEIKNNNVPIAIVITQIDNVDENELNEILDVLNEELEEIDIFTVCVTDDEEIAEILKSYNKKDELIKWALDNLDDTLQIALASSLHNQLDNVKRIVNSKVIPIYIASATAAAVVPIPFADSAVLTPIQLSMSMHIMSVYGIKKLNGAVTSVVNSVIVSQIGKMLATTLTGSLLKLIPGIGSIAGAAVNTTVATTITTTLGYAISELCYKYSKAVLNGEDVDIADFFNSEVLREAIKMFYKK